MALLLFSSDTSVVYQYKKRLTEKYFVLLTISLSDTHTRKKQRKKSFSLAFRSFNRTVDPSSKVLTLGKAKKKKFFFGFSLV